MLCTVSGMLSSILSSILCPVYYAECTCLAFEPFHLARPHHQYPRCKDIRYCIPTSGRLPQWLAVKVTVHPTSARA